MEPISRNPELPRASRLLVFFTPNGTIHNHWRPTGGESDFSFPAGSMLEALTPHRDELMVLDGMNFSTGSNHEGGMAAMLTAGGNTSIDLNAVVYRVEQRRY